MSNLKTLACVTALSTLPKDRRLAVLYELSKTVPMEVLAAIAEAQR